MTVMMSRQKRTLSQVCPCPQTLTQVTTTMRTVPYVSSVNPVIVGEISRNFAGHTQAYNNQLNRYLQNSNEIRKVLTKQGVEHIQYANRQHPTPNASLLRDKSSWSAVKNQVVREELMKLQISVKTDLPLTRSEIRKIQAIIKNKDLTIEVVDKLTDTTSKGNDPEVAEIISKIVRSRVERASDYLNALDQYKKTGKVSPILQKGKLAELSKELKDVDLSKLTAKEFKKLVHNYCETTEFHHKTSISKDPNQQNNPDNIQPLKTSEHDNQHRNQDGKVVYRDPVEGEPVNRQKDMKVGNKKRVFRNELKGLGVAVATGVGLGFCMSFVAEVAIKGISGDNIESLLSNSTKAGFEAGGLSAVTYGAGRLTTELVQKLGVNVATKSGVIINMATVGVISILVVSAISYVRMRWNGTERSIALREVGKQVAVSGSILLLSLIAQSAFCGCAGMLVSLSVGLIFLANGIITARHENEVSIQLQEYTVGQYRPLFSV